MNPPPRAITTYGLGHMRPFPGTWGSLPPAVLAAALSLVGIRPGHLWPIWAFSQSLVVVYFSIACVRQGDRAEARYGKKDPSQAVADETAGQALTLLFLPPAAFSSIGHGLLAILAAFIAFRLSDIIKPWPICAIQKVPSGWGILLDDLLAGVLAGLVCLIVFCLV